MTSVSTETRGCSGLQAGRLPVLEPGLDEMLAGNGERQIFTSEPARSDDL